MHSLVMEQPGTNPVRFPQTLLQNHKALRVLIIDDEELFCWTLTEILEDLNYAVFSAHAAVQGLEHFQRNQQIGLVLLDIRLSDVGETESLSLLGKFRTLRPRTPVIVMSAFGTRELKREADRLGALAFLDKPFRVETLLRLMREAIGEPIALNQRATSSLDCSVSGITSEERR
jgi:DNA-binding NtrC family response regulator